MLSSLVLSGINGAIAWSIQPVIDSLFVKKSAGLMLLLSFGIITLFFMRGLFSFITNYLMSSIGAKIARSIRQGVFTKLLSLPLSFYNRTPSAAVVSKMLNDVHLLQETAAFTMKDFFVEGCTVIVLAIVAITRRWDIALLSFVVVPLIILSIGKFGKWMKKTGMNTRLLIAKITSILQESLQGIKIIKAFTMEKKMLEKYESALTDHYRNTMRETRINEFSSFIAEFLGGVGIAIIMLYGGHLVISEKMTPGSFFSFITAILMMYTPLKRLSRVNNNFQQSRNVIERLKEIITEIPEKKGGLEKEIKGHIVFENVSFRYPSAEDYALKNINLEISPNEIIALVGYSGAGKSTLADLPVGFWNPTTGNVYIDNVNIKDLSLYSLRKHIGTVTQDVLLFDDTIKANIQFGRPDATEEMIIAAAKDAYAHEFIMELPEGYETRIGERGIRLSGGQKQRITIARAILRNPPILILDEATSSLDIESEQKVQKALERLMEGRTTVVIAHRFSTVKKATRIAVMSGGKIIQQGRHEDLIMQGGLYQELYNMQFASSGF
ncbi:MAG: ABC transporter ATP-binding protein [Candidatus Loosdrechtia sp.]|uniref:ABC transporter ATP-binding protein n=1 Tax=Candidatus Loosdrechtia sp. TaxID=3101272 RepID=UPI00403A7F77